MHAVRGRYTVRPDFAETNAANIARVMMALQTRPVAGLRYTAFCKEDGQTFVHIVVADSDEAQAAIPALPEFQAFQQALQASTPTAPPQAEQWDVVGSSLNL